MCTGTASLGMTTNGSLDGELLALEVVDRNQHGNYSAMFRGKHSLCPTKVVGSDVLLVEALISIDSICLSHPNYWY